MEESRVAGRVACGPHTPGLGLLQVALRILSSLMLAVIIPATLLWAMIELFNVTTAVLVCLAWMVLAMGWRYATRRPVSGLLLLSLAILTIKTAFTLISGSSFVYFVQPVFGDLAVSTIFLGSLWTSRPIIARLAPDFYPMSVAVADRPEIRAHFWRLTLLWGLVILVKGGITLWLLESLSTANFVLLKGGAIITLTLTAAVVTIAWSYVVVRQQGLLRSPVADDATAHWPESSG
ncbi:VC0807 family protein [Nocardioides nematodiphilus]|uniref:VC0807 family protein n=1 Tax=Nocardioides nematodiphilus TaxID=2849669 RepID=UPI001CD9530F|nr:VC0807 family protein [Nocardioides nematodiphilus]MCA1982203.1 hypothetical protein [Nocardioides nematodiphilus]